VEVAGIGLLPESCSPPVSVPASADGTVGPVYLTAGTGELGPPAGTASAATSFPCPPTADQQAAGATCFIGYATSQGLAVEVPISFASPGQSTVYSSGGAASNTGAPAGVVSGTTGASNTGAAAPAAATQGGGALAFTGAGREVWLEVAVGLVLLDLGYLALTAVARPRHLLRRRSRRA
jgi:hypothetical protein